MTAIWDVRQRLIDIGAEQTRQREDIDSIKCLVRDIEHHVHHMECLIKDMERILKQLYSQIIGEDLAITFNPTIPENQSTVAVQATATAVVQPEETSPVLQEATPTP